MNKRPPSYRQRRRNSAPEPRKGHLFGWALAVVSAVLLTGFGLYFKEFLDTTTRFNVQTVNITGLHVLDERTVLAASRITLDDNVLHIDEDEVAARVEALPYVKKCEVTVTFPDMINLQVEERAPVATVMVNSRAYEIDSSRIVLREYGAHEVPAEPYITNIPNLVFVEIGQELDYTALSSALRVWEAYSTVASGEGVRVAELAAFNEMDVRMYCDQVPYELRWGRGNYEQQARRLVVFWRQTGRGAGCSEYLDLRFGQDLACR